MSSDPAAPLSSDGAVYKREQLAEGYALLDHLSVIRVTGDDAASFLHSQFTCDVDSLSAGSQSPGAYCNPKGRAIALFHLLRNDDGFFLVLPADRAEAVSSRLKMFRMRAKAEIQVQENTDVIGFIGSAERIGFGSLWTLDDFRSMALTDRSNRDGIVRPGSQPLSASHWKLAGILAGDPQVYADTAETFIPQQINLDLIGGVSFRKGCYPGQEIIARVRYLGKIKQRMIPAMLRLEGSCPSAGAGLFTADRPDQKSGMVVDAVSCEDVAWVSAMVPTDLVERGEIRLGSAEGPLLERLPLPYEVAPAEDRNEDGAKAE